ncbi:MAG: hypothetical protein LRY54_00480 [Alphaproteobacteria bacterium]|nr:hypothetical protein [Alphaproteobacteria bacterium]MCD8562561.1 hypothetical protein [Alphaproteobacteria bacterium]
MRLVVLTVLSLVLGVVPAFASSCYMAQEAEAEQGIRIHSELMVIGLNCQHMASAGGQNLYTVYRDFTSRHLTLLETYEKILLASFKRDGDPRPVDRLNDMRTGFANKISNDAAKMRPDMFCQRYAPRIQKASTMSNDDVRRWAATIFPSHPVSKPVCASELAR